MESSKTADEILKDIGAKPIATEIATSCRDKEIPPMSQELVDAIKKTSEKMSFKEASELAEFLSAEAEAFWDNSGVSMDDRFSYRRGKSAITPVVPADGYHVYLEFYHASRYADDNVYLAYPGVLAGDGRLRNEDGSLYSVPEDELNQPIWSVMEVNWSEW